MTQKQEPKIRKPEVSQAIFYGDRIAYKVKMFGKKGGEYVSYFADWERAMEWANELATMQAEGRSIRPSRNPAKRVGREKRKDAGS